MTTHYDTLGIDRSASASDIKKAYRRLAKKYHPDANQGNQEAEEKFKAISEAYFVLSDPARREAYDKRLDDPGHTESESHQDQEYHQQRQRAFYRSMYVENSDVPYFKWKMAAFIAFVVGVVSLLTILSRPWEMPCGLPPEVLMMQIDDTRIEMKPGHPYYPLMLRLMQSSIDHEDEILRFPAMRLQLLLDSLDQNLESSFRAYE